MNHLNKIIYADDDTESVRFLLRLRIPPLLIGLVLGIGISILTSKFEKVLSTDIRAAFFIPFIVYITDAVGVQTQTIYTRDLKTGSTNFHKYLAKEICIGFILGATFGIISGFITKLWLHDNLLAMSVGISVFLAMFFAPLIAMIVTEIVRDIREDPAVGAGPIATVVQDATSVLIYGLVTSVILL